MGRLLGLSALVLVAFGLYAFSYFPDTVQVHPAHSYERMAGYVEATTKGSLRQDSGLRQDFWSQMGRKYVTLSKERPYVPTVIPSVGPMNDPILVIPKGRTLVAFGLYAFSYFPDTVQVHSRGRVGSQISYEARPSRFFQPPSTQRATQR